MALPALQSLPLLAWFKLVNDTVTEPYLDEVFHVRQAQHYCNNRFTIWDPKITTPPGLYLLSYLISPIAGCDLIWLRCLNLFCLVTLQAVITWTYLIRRRSGYDDWASQHSALNVTLFPSLFFFAALYYTDVPSTLSVLIFYWLFLHLNQLNKSSWFKTSVLVLAGTSSLLFRQTNIFWVSIFPAALVLVNELDQAHDAVKVSMHRRVEGFGDTLLGVAKTSWKMSAVYDPPVKDASIHDYTKTVISIVTVCLKLATQPKRLANILQSLTPFITIAASFTTFIIWNRGVVLGDKNNHIATFHLPQMLYIWPYFTFFSWPLIYPYLITLPFGLIALLPNIATLESMLMFNRRGVTPALWLLASSVALACIVVRYNTIVHPFTLADNRHYTFYVFRRLMRPRWIKFAVTPIYIICGWACIQALGARPYHENGNVRDSGNVSGKIAKTTPAMTDQNFNTKPLSLPDGSKGATTSFVLIWLATSTLQLVTAPLVEPRYLILPWIFWRIHVPLQRYSPAQVPKTASTIKARLAAVDHRLWLETAWLLLINAATGYMFLYRGFEWPQEPGKVQRFMW